MLDVVRRRAAALAPGDVLAQYERDRFVRPAAVGARRLLEVEMLALDALAPIFEPIVMSPLVPLGTHSTVAGVHQNRVVSTIRGSEVAADPTNTLALEAAVRRRRLLGADPHAPTTVDLAGIDRVVRAQRFDGSRSLSHFSLLGLVSAGRDTGNHSFERDALVRHLRALRDVVHRAGHQRIVVELTDFGGRHHDVIEAAVTALADAHTAVAPWPQRPQAGDYYPNVCCKVSAAHGEELIEIGDGGFVTWTQDLVGSRKERLMISGLSLERLAGLGSLQSGA
jgi:hypothetical protein